MDTSIRLYNSNSRLHSILDAEKADGSTSPLPDEEVSPVEAAPLDEGERATDTISRQSVDDLDALQEQVPRVDADDLHAISLNLQWALPHFILRPIPNRAAAYVLKQHAFEH